MKRTVFFNLALLLIVTGCISCHKDFLDKKPDKKLVIPHTLTDLQAILDNTDYMNARSPYLGESGSADYFIPYNRWQLLPESEKYSHIWAADAYGAQEAVDWDWTFRRIFYANIALEGLDGITVNNTTATAWNNIKGSALFYRAWNHFMLAQLFCEDYNKLTDNSVPGIPVRLVSDINLKPVRITVKETYNQLLNDLYASIPLLPEIPLKKTRPSKQAAYSLLAKVYLQMEDYKTALIYADSALAINGELMDFKTYTPAGTYTFLQFNQEVIFSTMMTSIASFANSYLNIDPQLYHSYKDSDIRKAFFFVNNNGIMTFKGSYDGSNSLFSGIATNELYLIRAECHARNGNAEKALNDLNTLLEKRFTQKGFVAVATPDPEHALRIILEERRKELIYRGIRWSDLRRLNKDPRFAVTLERNLNGEKYTLLPNDKRYVLPIPDYVISFNGMQQNPR